MNYIPARGCFMDVLQLITAHPLEKPGDRRGNGRGKIFVIAGKNVGRLRIHEFAVERNESREARRMHRR